MTTGSGKVVSFFDLDFEMLNLLFFFSGRYLRVKIYDWIVNSIKEIDLSNSLWLKFISV